MCKVQLKNARLRPFVLFMALFLMNVSWAFAQLTVTGRVQSKSGEPLIGVNVVEKGTTNGTVTDLDGNYSLRTEKGKTLVFSYIGFLTQENVVKGARMNITLLEDTETLDEVVVIGYGSMQRKDVTSSITSVKAEDLNVGVVTSPAQMLQGKVPGLTVANTSDPNGSASISLRGASSLRAGEAMEPYYVIDGVPGASLSLIAPDDIESIDVLRDASATAIYGSKAANGVIIVTTKKGKKDGHTSVSYSGYVAWDKTMNSLDMMTADQLLDFASKNNIDLSPYYDVNNPANTNWQDEVLRTGFSHNHNVSINGGNEKTSYSASINFMDRQGVVRGTSMDRLNARSFVQTKALNNRLELAFSVNASVRNSSTGPTGGNGQSVLDAMYYYSPLVPVKNADGSWYGNTQISQNYNPVRMISEDRYDTKEKLLQGTAQATLHIIDGLDWNLNLSYQNQQYIYSNYNSSKTELPSVASRNGQADRSTLENTRKQMETYLNWNHTFADTHKVGVMLGYSWEQADNNDGFGLKVYNFYNDDLTYHNLGVANNISINDVISNNLSTLRMISFYGRVNYSYKSKYLLQATVRRDGSSAFGVNNRWGTFPSVSAAWRITEEDFMKDQSVFDDLKLRVGYGVSGNSLGFDAFYSRPIYGATGWFTYVDANGTSSQYRILGATRNSNPDLKWETTGMFNIGVDFGFLNNRLTGTIEYYDKRTSDLIFDYAVSTNRYPYGWMTANVGDISNKGVEITINAVPVKTHNFTWSTTLNLSHNKNVVEKLSNDMYSVEYSDRANPDVGGYTSTQVQRIMEGSPLGQFYLYEWAGYDENGGSIFNDYDADGNLIGTTDAPSDEDRRPHGSAQPKLTYGWNNDFTWKNWTLTAFFQGVAGNKIFNATRCYYNNVSLVSNGKNVLAEVAEGQNAHDSRAQAPSDRYLENGSYLRLSTLTLGYNFGKLGNWINNLRLYATCNNVFTITGYKGVDPEISLGGLEPGMDWRNTTYPRTRTFMVGVNVNF
ncbi:TonB-dependent receptor [Bacteroides mediterraneensis]|jgi:TonB-linked SusC/RagA family outer membrane protein|uniref:SusC/RagA family TonB-linked outer membrane protein n=1 Tax=Phocaeicola sp. TaxID=2773926 RepID=UPI0003410B43|nr:TonB-dependent receptor [Bacteroides mediterraneensis]CDD47232.1 tonB-dependent receptor [Bacteroides sp. CAG:875]